MVDVSIIKETSLFLSDGGVRSWLKKQFHQKIDYNLILMLYFNLKSQKEIYFLFGHPVADFWK